MFGLFGFTDKPEISVGRFTFDKKNIQIGTSALLSVTILSKAKKKQKLSIDYAVHYMKKNGKDTS